MTDTRRRGLKHTNSRYTKFLIRRLHSNGQYRFAVASGESTVVARSILFETYPTLPRIGTDRLLPGVIFCDAEGFKLPRGVQIKPFPYISFFILLPPLCFLCLCGGGLDHLFYPPPSHKEHKGGTEAEQMKNEKGRGLVEVELPDQAKEWDDRS